MRLLRLSPFFLFKSTICVQQFLLRSTRFNSVQGFIAERLTDIVQFIGRQKNNNNKQFRGWKRNNWISLIHYSIHFFLSYSLFLIQFCSIFIIPFQVCRVIIYSECLNPKYSLFIAPAETRGGILGFPACIHIRNLKM